MPYGGGTLFRRGRVWWLQYWVRGERRRESSGTADRTLALQRLQERLAATGRATHVVQRGGVVTVGDLLDLVVRDYELRRSPAMASVRSRVRAVRAQLGDVEAMTLTPLHVEAVTRGWLREPSPQGGTLAIATINGRLIALKRAFALGRERRLIPDLPVRVRPLAGANVREGFVSADELAGIVVRFAHPVMADLAWWLFYTGQRVGEARQMQWDWYDADSHTLLIRRQATKTKRPKSLPLVGPFGEVFARRLAARDSGCRYVFHRNGAALPKETITGWWKAARKAAGLPQVRIHDLRRSGVRNLIRAGVDRDVVRMISGHQTDYVFSRYNITASDDLEQAAELLGRYLSRQPARRHLRLAR